MDNMVTLGEHLLTPQGYFKNPRVLFNERNEAWIPCRWSTIISTFHVVERRQFVIAEISNHTGLFIYGSSPHNYQEHPFQSMGQVELDGILQAVDHINKTLTVSDDPNLIEILYLGNVSREATDEELAFWKITEAARGKEVEVGMTVNLQTIYNLRNSEEMTNFVLSYDSGRK